MKNAFSILLIAACVSVAFAGDYIVHLSDDADQQAHVDWVNSIVGRDGSVKFIYTRVGFHGYAVSTKNPAFIQEMNADPDVLEVFEDAAVELAVAPEFWGLDRSNQRELPLDLDLEFCGLDGAGVDVYIIDTGIVVEHPDFGGRASWGVNLVGDGIDTDCNGRMFWQMQ